MHYGKDIASYQAGVPSMVTRDPKMIDVIGNQQTGHELDYEKVRRIYECKGSYPKVPQPPAPSGRK